MARWLWYTGIFLLVSAGAVSAQPTMQQTAEWLGTAAPRYMHVTANGPYRRVEVNGLRLVGCHLGWTEQLYTPGEEHQPAVSRVYDIALSEVDLHSIRLSIEPELSTYPPVHAVWLQRRNSSGNFTNGAVMTEAGRLLVRADGGERVLNAVYRAAVLCGATAEPF